MSDAITPDDIFTCQKCGDCCRGYGGTFVADKDIQRISRYLNMDSSQFVAEFCQISGGKPVLTQGDNGYCIFWDRLCTIHPVKPQMCKKWPFIGSILADVNNWHIIAACCSGIRTDVPDRLIKECVKKKLSTCS
ncbi:MAG: YkgJ family cysteine cluster protein [Desulfobacterales bacterium]|nr:MAG: YkgJ family cysteine cluster protein [Desulfobacterales bacterium]